MEPAQAQLLEGSVINIGHLFYYGERDQYWTTILLWRKWINIGHWYEFMKAQPDFHVP